jgi:fatty acid-binding protein DegV
MFDGNPTSERKRTREGAYRRLLALLDEAMPIERIALLHTHAEPAARELLRRVQGVLPAGPIPAVDITPVIGAHIGPGAVGFAVISTSQLNTG